MRTLRYVLTAAFAAVLLLPPTAPTRADDSDIFMIDSIDPNVVILIDTSGSMGNRANGEVKMAVARDVVTYLLNNVQNVNFGLFAFDSDGGRLVAEIGTPTATMVSRVAGLNASGGTPLGRATEDVQDYYYGNYVEGQSGGGGDDDDDECDDDDDDDGGCGGGTPPVMYDSPIEYECQKNYAILITDGMPTGESETLVVTHAGSLYSSDHESVLDGTQNVIVHTVGFAVPEGRTLLTNAATAGGGNFYEASNRATLAQALLDAVTAIVEDSYSFSATLIPSTATNGGDQAYMGSFRPNPSAPFWEGYFAAYTRDSDGLVPTDADGLPLSTAQAWEAGALLAARAASTRTIYTHVGSSREEFARGNSAITQALLGVSNGNDRNRVIDFVRGIDGFDRDGDGNLTEERDWKLGDVFHSEPVLIAAPPLRLADPTYTTFKLANASRTPIVLVGANDGMMHAFRASDGFELWGFIPPDQLDRLQYQTPLFADHVFSVDSTPVVTDVKISGTWKTIAVFGTRRGGRTVHALDVTSPTNPQYLWGFTDAELGETWSVPAIGRVALADGTERTVAFFGGGYDTPSNNASGRSFYVVDVTDGTLLWKYAVQNSADKRYMNFSLAAEPTAADLTGNGLVDAVFIGDVGGQLWKFDVSSPATFTSGLVDNWTGKRLFVADTAQANPPAAGEYYPSQGFYGAPVLAYDDKKQLWVYMGTGDRNHPKATSSNYFFGFVDDLSMTNGAYFDKSDLVDVGSGSDITRGWYRNLASNEKVLDAAEVYDEVVYFSTYQPATTVTCETAAGYAALYAVRSGDGKPGIDWTDEEKTDSTDGSASKNIGGGIPSKPSVVQGPNGDSVVVGTTDEELESITMTPARTKNIRYWREVY